MTQRFAFVGDRSLWSEDFGNPSDPPLLLIMGANASGLTWPDPFVQMLAAGGMRVIRYDHRDTGRSTGRDFEAQPYSLQDLAADAIAVLDAYGIDEAHVVGFSMGATLGQVLALDYRHRLTSLALVCGAALDVDFAGNIERSLAGVTSHNGLPTPRASVLRVLARRADPPRDRDSELARRLAEWRALWGSESGLDIDAMRRQELKVLGHAGTLTQPTAHARAAPVPIERAAELKGVTTPTLVIQAPNDPINPPPHGKHLAELIPGAVYAEIPGMGHALPPSVHRPLADKLLAHARAHPTRF